MICGLSTRKDKFRQAPRKESKGRSTKTKPPKKKGRCKKVLLKFMTDEGYYESSRKMYGSSIKSKKATKGTHTAHAQSLQGRAVTARQSHKKRDVYHKLEKNRQARTGKKCDKAGFRPIASRTKKKKKRARLSSQVPDVKNLVTTGGCGSLTVLQCPQNQKSSLKNGGDNLTQHPA